MSYHRTFYNSNMTGATSGEGTALLLRTHEFTRDFCLIRFTQYLFSVYSFADHCPFVPFFSWPLHCLRLFDLCFKLLLWGFQTSLGFEHRNGYITIYFKGKECTAI